MGIGNIVTDVNYILENGIKILKGLPLIETSRLKRHPKNVKKHPEEQIKNLMELMKIVGFKDPIVIDKDEGVKAGHGRLDAAERLGMKRVPYIPLEGLTKKQMDLFMYMDNQVNESPWIDDNVQYLLEDVSLPDLDTFDVNWDNIIQIEIEDETEAIPLPPKNPKSKLGQIYKLGNHKIICGDATIIETFEKLFGPDKAAIGFTSPPYNIGKGEKKYQNSKDNLNNENYLKFLIEFTNHCIQYCKFSFVDIQFLAANKVVFIEYLYELRKNIVDKMIWNKKHGQPPGAKNVLNGAIEDIIIFSGPEAAKRRQITTAHFNGTVENIYEGHGNHGNEYSDIHKATFPIDLPQYFIQTFSKTNDIVFDPFLGTGTTLIAAQQTQRICYGIELDPGYMDIIIQRWEKFTGNKAELLC